MQFYCSSYIFRSRRRNPQLRIFQLVQHKKNTDYGTENSTDCKKLRWCDEQSHWNFSNGDTALAIQLVPKFSPPEFITEPGLSTTASHWKLIDDVARGLELVPNRIYLPNIAFFNPSVRIVFTMMSMCYTNWKEYAEVLSSGPLRNVKSSINALV